MRGAYGWIPSIPDQRDRVAPPGPVAALPAKHSLRAEMPPIWDQGQLGSCTAHGTGRLVLHRLMRQGMAKPADTPSRLFIYYGARDLEGSTASDSGAQVRDALKVTVTRGAPPETDWPYSDANPGPFTTRPPGHAYTDALRHRALRYYAESKGAVKWCIVNGYPVVFGITVYQSFESEQVARDGLVPMPASGEAVAGGHCMVIVGFDDERGLYEVDNSWGPGWGDGGRCWLPQAYVNGPDSADFWTVRLES